jgi:N-acyl-D-amino-acid deacylase
MGIEDRGRIREGMVADLVLFDPDTVIDNATPENPQAISTGILSVWVGGELVYTDGATTGARPGQIIRPN